MHVTVFNGSTNQSQCKFYYVNMGHDQGIGVILCRFHICTMIYSVVPVYYCLDHSSSTISSGDLKLCFGLQNVTSEPTEHCGFVDPQGGYWRY